MGYKNKGPLTPGQEVQLVHWQRETMFPAELLPESFNDTVESFFSFVSPYSLRMPFADYKHVVSIKDNNYTILDMNTICHVIRSRNANELGWDMEMYVKFQESIETISLKVLELISAEEMRLKGGKTIAMPTIAAEA